MKITITSQVNTNVGLPVTGMVGTINAHTQNLLTTGIIFCDIEFYASDDAKTKKMNKLFPVTLKEDGTINKSITTCSISLTEQEVVAANLPATIYNKVAAKLNTDFGWTVTVS